MKKQLIVLAALVALVLTGCSKPQTAWITSLDDAKASSAKSKKDLMVVFTGSDWNDPSKALIADVFTEDFFKKGSKKFVLCNIDVVQDETLMDADTLNKNYTTATDYGVQNLPLIVLQTPEGDVYASTAPAEETTTADALFTFLDTFKDARKSIIDMKKSIKSAKGADKAKAIDTFIEATDVSRRQQYGDLIRQVPELDADGAAGLKGKYELQIAYLDMMDLYEQGKMTDAGDLFIKLAEGTSLNAAQKQEAWYMGAYMNAMAGTVENEKIVGWLQNAIDADPQNEGSSQIQATIDQLKAMPATKTEAAK